MAKRTSIVVAMDRKGVIGKDNRLPWHLPVDLKHFKQITMGKPIIMGRKTFESIGRALPGRSNIVVTRNRDYRAPGCEVAGSLQLAFEKAGPVAEVMIVGGAELYREALAWTERIYLTRIDADVDGDTCFPPMDTRRWLLVNREEHPADENNAYACVFETLERISQ